MSRVLAQCCQNTLESMQGVAELASVLKVFLAASPIILVIPDILVPGSSQEAVETLSEKLVQMSGEKVLSNVVDTSSLPDFADAVRNVNKIATNRMHQFAQIHSLRHPGQNIEGKLWKEMREIYDPKGEIRSGNSGGGWGFW